MTSWIKQNRGFLLFLLAFGFMRTAVADWNPIPSGSMRPTLLEGDVVLVNRVAFDLKVPLTDVSLLRLGEPQRGDVVTFTSPGDGARLIKRLVAVAGDTVEMRDEVLIINGAVATYSNPRDVTEPVGNGRNTPAVQSTEQLHGSERTVQFFPDVAAKRNFGPVTVPKDSFLMLGDSRDNSIDSRYYGFVPRHLLIGRAHRILVSADTEGWRLRLDRAWSRL